MALSSRSKNGASLGAADKLPKLPDQQSRTIEVDTERVVTPVIPTVSILNIAKNYSNLVKY